MLDLYNDLLATLQALDGNLHLNYANEMQSEESFQLQQKRLIEARRLIEEAAAHAYGVHHKLPSHARLRGTPNHVSMASMRKDEICAMLARMEDE